MTFSWEAGRLLKGLTIKNEVSPTTELPEEPPTSEEPPTPEEPPIEPEEPQDPPVDGEENATPNTTITEEETGTTENPEEIPIEEGTTTEQSPLTTTEITSETVEGERTPLVEESITPHETPTEPVVTEQSEELEPQTSKTTTEDITITYKYNDAGIRTEKTINGVTTKYFLSGDKVIRETNGTDTIWYTYDSTDNLIYMNLNGTEYYYVRNAQSDIIGLIDGAGEEVVSYTYDSWGKLISIDGSLKDTVGEKNPYRYRGYRYDIETGLYYLQSRYYNAEWGRFVNGDDFEILKLSQGELLNHNLFTYCTNNPVMYSDPTGYAAAFGVYFIPGVGQVLLLASLVVVSVGLTIYVGTTAYNKIKTYFASKNRNIKAPAKRYKFSSKKKAYEAAKKAGGGKKPRGPEYHGDGWHYHPNVKNAYSSTPKQSCYHDHYYY